MTEVELMIKIIKWCYSEFTMGTLTNEEANAILEEMADNLENF